jgi:hypothetical protein
LPVLRVGSRKLAVRGGVAGPRGVSDPRGYRFQGCPDPRGVADENGTLHLWAMVSDVVTEGWVRNGRPRSALRQLPTVAAGLTLYVPVCSKAWAARNTVSSSHFLPMSIMPTGRLSERPQGTDIAG